jgi:hypothetical protein
MLQVNITVLATAHAVSEGIVRGVNVELQRRNVPNTYTASRPARSAEPAKYLAAGGEQVAVGFAPRSLPLSGRDTEPQNISPPALSRSLQVVNGKRRCSQAIAATVPPCPLYLHRSGRRYASSERSAFS